MATSPNVKSVEKSLNDYLQIMKKSKYKIVKDDISINYALLSRSISFSLNHIKYYSCIKKKDKDLIMSALISYWLIKLNPFIINNKKIPDYKKTTFTEGLVLYILINTIRKLTRNKEFAISKEYYKILITQALHTWNLSEDAFVMLAISLFEMGRNHYD